MNRNKNKPRELEVRKEIPYPDREALERAEGLLAALMDYHVSEAVKVKIQEWFLSDAGNDIKYDALRKLFADLRPNLDYDKYELEKFDEISRMLGLPQTPLVSKSARLLPVKRYAWRVAAVLIPAIVVIAALFFRDRGPDSHVVNLPLANVRISVPEEVQKRIVLPDGSQVWINSSSEVAYNDDFSERRIVTLDGEAYFSVVSDPSRPFSVVCGDFTVEVLGTEFNVRSRAGEFVSEVVLKKGSVEIASGKDRYKLEPDQSLTLERSTKQYNFQRVSADTVSLWRVQRLYFDNTPVEEALGTVAMYFGREISMPGWKPTGDLINLDLDGDPTPGQVLDIIRDITGNFNYQITLTQIIITQTELPPSD